LTVLVSLPVLVVSHYCLASFLIPPPRSFPPLFFFFFNDPATTEIYTLSLHDALPISRRNTCRPPPGCPPSSTTDCRGILGRTGGDRKSTRLNSSHVEISYAVFCLKKKKK